MKKRYLTALTLALLFIIGPTAYAKVAAPSAAPAAVDLNRASADELMAVPHLGPKKAAQIIAHRQEKPFTSVDELVEIKGIGPKSLEKIRPHVTVKAKAPKTP